MAAGVFAVAGAMFIASATASQDGALRVDRTGGLAAVITDRADENAGLALEVDRLTARVSALLAQGDPDVLLDEMNEQSAQLAPSVGLTEVKGPGVSVTLDDAQPPDPMPDGFTGDDYIVHQQDVQGVVNALWRGGASGVTVMGQRLISTSAVRCVGNTVILQGQVYSPPFVIEAVGDVARLNRALAADDSVRFFREWADVVGLGYQQTNRPRMTLPAYTGPTTTDDSQVIP